ncbi:MAG: hypothetical protein Q8Q97_02950 [bacterium]|nr:hypothetical protein [bacterium]
MPEARIDIPNIDSAVGYYFDAGTFVWSLIVIGTAVFFFLATFGALRRSYRDGNHFGASVAWFVNFLVLILGVSLLARAFRNLTAFVAALALVGFAAAFGWSRAAKKKEEGEKDKTKEKR